MGIKGTFKGFGGQVKANFFNFRTALNNSLIYISGMITVRIGDALLSNIGIWVRFKTEANNMVSRIAVMVKKKE